MKQSVKILSVVSLAAGLAFGGISVINNTNSNIAVQSVQAAATTHISLPTSEGYTKKNILKANNNKLSNSDKNKLIKASMSGMASNKFTDDDPADNRTVDVTKLSPSDKEEISRYALAVINSARNQMGKSNWTYTRRANKFADEVAKCYNQDGASVWDADHDVRGIKRAAKACGLNYKAGQVYEDEAGLPWNSTTDTTRTMKKLKEQIYFNIKQMLFGGFSGNDIHNASAYTEWEHAGDLLGLRSMKGYDAPTKEFAISFSTLDKRHISVHMLGVAKRYIWNYKKYNA